MLRCSRRSVPAAAPQTGLWVLGSIPRDCDVGADEQERPDAMTYDAELVKEARKLADGLECRLEFAPTTELTVDGLLAITIRKLADLVEKQDTDLGAAVAACVSCDTEMTRILGLYEDKYGIWNDVRAPRHRARYAANLAEPVASTGATDERQHGTGDGGAGDGEQLSP